MMTKTLSHYQPSLERKLVSLETKKQAVSYDTIQQKLMSLNLTDRLLIQYRFRVYSKKQLIQVLQQYQKEKLNDIFKLAIYEAQIEIHHNYPKINEKIAAKIDLGLINTNQEQSLKQSFKNNLFKMIYDEDIKIYLINVYVTDDGTVYETNISDDLNDIDTINKLLKNKYIALLKSKQQYVFVDSKLPSLTIHSPYEH